MLATPRVVTLLAAYCALVSGCILDKPAADSAGKSEAAGAKNSAPPAAAAPATGSDAKAAPLGFAKRCDGATKPAGDGLIDDFEDNDDATALVAAREGHWFVGKDDKGSSVEPSSLAGKFAEGGAHGGKRALHISGKTAGGDGAWGVETSVDFAPSRPLYDASKYAGISFWIKAGAKGTKDVRFKISDVNTNPNGGVCKDGCWNHFGKDLKITSGWQEVRVPFAEMTQLAGWGEPRPANIDSKKIFDLEWSIASGQEFDLWIDDVKFIDCQ